MKKLVINPNERYHRLTTIKESEERIRGRPTWVCLCDCGKECLAQAKSLKNGDKKSCGCLNKEKMIENLGGKGSNNICYKHGNHETLTYKRWVGMKRRCNHKPAYSDVEVCDRWVTSFNSFLEDMGKCPSENHTLDRIDNSLGYSPDNCRWATPKEQARNKTNNFLVEGIALSQYCEENSLRYELVLSRLSSTNPEVKGLAFTLTEKSLNLLPRKNRKLSDEEVVTIRKLYSSKSKTITELAKEFDMSTSTVNSIVKYRTYKELP